MKNNLRRIAVFALALSFIFISLAFPSQVKADEASDNIPIYRLYNPDNGEHLYTSDAHESEVLHKYYGWGYEGIAWYCAESGTPVYRLYNSGLCNHLYTTDTNEINFLMSMPDTEWTMDNNGQPVFYSFGEVPIFRLYNEGLQGMHHLTTDKNEYNTLAGIGWNKEGIAFFAAETGSPIKTDYVNKGDNSDSNNIKDVIDNINGDIKDNILDDNKNSGSEDVKYVLNTKAKKFHTPDCGFVNAISADNKENSTASREELIEQGYTPCLVCKP